MSYCRDPFYLYESVDGFHCVCNLPGRTPVPPKGLSFEELREFYKNNPVEIIVGTNRVDALKHLVEAHGQQYSDPGWQRAMHRLLSEMPSTDDQDDEDFE